jgi:hypothetical protein
LQGRQLWYMQHLLNSGRFDNMEKQYASTIADTILSLFDKESENHTYSLEEIDATAFFTGFFLAFWLLYQRLTPNKGDLIDAVSLVNRLTFQHLNREKE